MFQLALMEETRGRRGREQRRRRHVIRERVTAKGGDYGTNSPAELDSSGLTGEDDQPCDERVNERQSVNGLRRSGRNSMAERDQILGFDIPRSDVPRSKVQAVHDATNSQ